MGMKHVAAAFVWVLAGCMGGAEDEWGAAGLDPAANASNNFGFALHAKLPREGNLVYSPISLHTTLAMAYAGARDTTASQMATMLGLPTDGRDMLPIHQSIASLLQSLRDAPPTAGASAGGPLVRILNGIWVPQGTTVQPEFGTIMSNVYHAQGGPLDFSQPTATDTINRWVAEGTTDPATRIAAVPSLFDQPLDSATRIVLANVLFFKGAWERPFDPSKTTPGDFRGSSVQIPFMTQAAEFRCTDPAHPRLQAVAMPFQGSSFEMVLVTTAASSQQTLAQLEENMAGAGGLFAALDAATPLRIQLRVPKFKISTAVENLPQVLQGLGMQDAWVEGTANFAGIDGVLGSDTQRRTLHLNRAVHKTVLDVNETGVSLAAASGLAGTRGLDLSQPPTFSFDRPFLAFIRDRSTGAILGVARYSTATAQ